jgi:hypothetical protein
MFKFKFESNGFAICKEFQNILTIFSKLNGLKPVLTPAQPSQPIFSPGVTHQVHLATPSLYPRSFPDPTPDTVNLAGLTRAESDTQEVLPLLDLSRISRVRFDFGMKLS